MCPKESNITTRSIPHIHTLRTDFFFPHSQGRGIQHLPDGNPGYCQQLEALMFGERAQQLANVEINPHPPPKLLRVSNRALLRFQPTAALLGRRKG